MQGKLGDKTKWYWNSKDGRRRSCQAGNLPKPIKTAQAGDLASKVKDSVATGRTKNAGHTEYRHIGKKEPFDPTVPAHLQLGPTWLPSSPHTDRTLADTWMQGWCFYPARRQAFLVPATYRYIHVGIENMKVSQIPADHKYYTSTLTSRTTAVRPSNV